MRKGQNKRKDNKETIIRKGIIRMSYTFLFI